MELPYHLTPSQIKILEMASDGFTDKEICRSLGIAPGTLRTYWDRLRKRCDSRSRSEVISKMQHGLSPQRLKLVLLEKLPVYIWTTDEEGRIDYCNEFFVASGGLERKAVVKHGLSSLVVETERPEFLEFIREGLEGDAVVEGVWNLTTDKGESAKRHKVRLFPFGQGKKRIGYAREIAQDADHQMTQFLMALLK